MPIASRLAFYSGQLEMKASRRRLLSKLPKHGIGAEVGVWKGDGTAAMLRYARPKRLYLIDPWEHQPDYEDAMYGKADTSEMDAMHAAVCRRFAPQIASGQVDVIRSRSDEIDFPENSLDWAWIDGDHTYEAVKADLQSFARMVKPGGFLAGDDYTLDWWGDDVIRAVDEFPDVEIVGKQHFLIRVR